MAKKLISIEIGDRLVKCCVAAKSGKKLHVEQSFYFQTPDDAVIDGQIMVPEVLAEVLGGQLKERNLLGVRLATMVMSSSKVVSREVTLPSIKPAQIGAMVRANAAEYFPVDVTNYQISQVILEKFAGEGGYRVLVTAAPRPLIGGYVRVAELANLSLQALDVAANSQYQILQKLPMEGNTMFVSVGDRQTRASFLNEGKLLMQRSLPFGGEELVTAAMRAADMDDSRFDEALELCREEFWLDRHLGVEEQEEGTYRLVNGIARSADFFKSSNKGAGVDRIVLMDSCANLGGMQTAIANGVNIESMNLSQYPGVERIPLSGNVDVSFYITCLGSFLAPLDLLSAQEGQKKLRRKENSTDSLRLGIIVLSVLGGAGLLLAGIGAFNLFYEGYRLTQTQERIIELEPVRVIYDTYAVHVGVEENLQILEEHSLNNNANLRAFIEELERKMPSSLLVLSASCDDNGVMMNIEVSEMADVAVVMSQLRGFETIGALQMSAVSEATNDAGLATVSFSVTCTYMSAVEEEAPLAVQTEEDSMLMTDEEIQLATDAASGAAIGMGPD